MKTKITSAASAALLALFFIIGTAFTGNTSNEGTPGNESAACLPVVLTSAPSTVNVTSYTCGTTGTRICSNSFTLSGNSTCTPFTWVFTNTTTGWTCTYVTSGTTLTAWINGSAGDAITLTITDSNGNSSPTYNFTGVGC